MNTCFGRKSGYLVMQLLGMQLLSKHKMIKITLKSILTDSFSNKSSSKMQWTFNGKIVSTLESPVKLTAMLDWPNSLEHDFRQHIYIYICMHKFTKSIGNALKCYWGWFMGTKVYCGQPHVYCINIVGTAHYDIGKWQTDCKFTFVCSRKEAAYPTVIHSVQICRNFENVQKWNWITRGTH